MTEPDQPCIRGCLRDCRCDACMTAPAPVHDPVPMPASDGLICRACSSKMRRWLETVCDDTLTLNLRIPDNYGWDHGHQHAKVSGSPALIRLEPLALVDPRTGPVEEESADYEENQNDLSRSIPFMVCSWAAMFAEENEFKSDVSTMAASVKLLLAQWERLTGSLWVDDFYADLAKIKQALNRAHNYRPAVEIGPCFRCDDAVRKEEGNGEEHAVCRCGRVYTGAELFKLHLQKNHDALDELIRDTVITAKHAQQFIALKYPQHPTPRESTIRSWLNRGNITTAANGGIDLDSLKEWFITTRDQAQARRRHRKTG